MPPTWDLTALKHRDVQKRAVDLAESGSVGNFFVRYCTHAYPSHHHRCCTVTNMYLPVPAAHLCTGKYEAALDVLV